MPPESFTHLLNAPRLYVPAGYPSMHAYCVDALHLSEDAAYKRIQAARAARQFPTLFVALSEGRLHLAAVCLLAPHLNPANADQLVAEAVHQRKSEIERRLAQRFPRPEVLGIVETIPGASVSSDSQPAPPQKEEETTECPRVEPQLAPGQVAASRRAKMAPISAEGFLLSVTIGKRAHDNLRYAQSLLGHAIPSGDVAQVLDRALITLVSHLEKRKFGATSQPRPRQRVSANQRHVPNHVRRVVWERDQGQCTFVSQTGHRCRAHKFLEFDHIDPVARGGKATADRMRLRCRAHNQYEAERVFGAESMRYKRQESRAAQVSKAPRTLAPHRTAKAPNALDQDVVPWLRALGFRADEARAAAERCDVIPDAPLEQRVRFALQHLGPRAASLGRAVAVGRT